MSEPFEQPSTRQLKAPVELETFLGGRGLQAVGLISMFLSAAFFFKLAVDHGWLPPVVRVLIGLVAGSAFMLSGVVLQRRPAGNRAIVEGLLALGGALCYLSLWAAGPLFDLIASPIAFAGMDAITCALIVLAARHRSLLTALYGLIGGLLTPAFLPHADQQLILAACLIVLCGGMLKLADDPHFKMIPLVAFGGALAYVTQFEITNTWNYIDNLIIASVFFLEFAVARFAVARRTGTMDRLDIILNACTIAAFAWMLEADLSSYLDLLAVMLFALSALLVTAALKVRAGAEAHALYLWSGTLALALAIPAYFSDRPWMMAGGFAVEGLLMYALGAYRGYPGFRAGGLIATVTAVPLGVLDIVAQPATTAMFYDRLSMFAMMTIALFAIAKIAHNHQHTANAAAWEGDVGSIAVTLANLVAVIGIGEVTYMVPDSFAISLSQQQLITSVSWTLLAGIIFAVALRRDSAVLRRQSLGLFAVTIVKVLAIDLASIELIDRIGVCFGLGVATLIVSAVYLRRMQQTRLHDADPNLQPESGVG